jgi:hypothetical protein
MRKGEWVMLRNISGDELGRFHKAKNVTNIACSRCGASTWNIESTNIVPESGAPEFSSEGTLVTPGLSTLTLSCINCGNLWMMAYEPIVQWLEENPA